MHYGRVLRLFRTAPCLEIPSINVVDDQPYVLLVTFALQHSYIYLIVTYLIQMLHII